jgi:chaperonin GroES
LPESAKEKPSRGTVVSTGKGKPNEPMELKEGDIVYYQSSVGFDFKYKGEVHKVLRQSDVYLVE